MEQLGGRKRIRTLKCLLLILFPQKEIRSSLVLSMLQQMLAEDKADMVREAVVKSLGIIMGYIDDADKYSQVFICRGKIHSLLCSPSPFPLGFRYNLTQYGQRYWYIRLLVEDLAKFLKGFGVYVCGIFSSVKTEVTYVEPYEPIPHCLLL